MTCKFRRKGDKLIAEFFVTEFNDEEIDALIEEMEKSYFLVKKIVKAKKELKGR